MSYSTEVCVQINEQTDSSIVQDMTNGDQADLAEFSKLTTLQMEEVTQMQNITAKISKEYTSTFVELKREPLVNKS